MYVALAVYVVTYILPTMYIWTPGIHGISCQSTPPTKKVPLSWSRHSMLTLTSRAMYGFEKSRGTVLTLGMYLHHSHTTLNIWRQLRTYILNRSLRGTIHDRTVPKLTMVLNFKNIPTKSFSNFARPSSEWEIEWEIIHPADVVTAVCKKGISKPSKHLCKC